MKTLVLLTIVAGVMLAACGRDDAQAEVQRPVIEVSLSDFTNLPEVGWAVTASQSSVSEGRVSFHVMNVNTADSNEDMPDIPHELFVIKSDLPLEELPRLGPGLGVDVSGVDVRAVVPALLSGEGTVIDVDLEEGNYILVCNVNPNGLEFAAHYQEGMFTGFTATD